MIVNALLVPVNVLYFNKLAKAFDKGHSFGVGLFLFSPLFLLILAFDSSKYNLAQENNQTNNTIDYASKTTGFNEDYNPYNIGMIRDENDEEKL